MTSGCCLVAAGCCLELFKCPASETLRLLRHLQVDASGIFLSANARSIASEPRQTATGRIKSPCRDAPRVQKLGHSANPALRSDRRRVSLCEMGERTHCEALKRLDKLRNGTATRLWLLTLGRAGAIRSSCPRLMRHCDAARSPDKAIMLGFIFERWIQSPPGPRSNPTYHSYSRRGQWRSGVRALSPPQFFAGSQHNICVRSC